MDDVSDVDVDVVDWEWLGEDGSEDGGGSGK